MSSNATTPVPSSAEPPASSPPPVSLPVSSSPPPAPSSNPPSSNPPPPPSSAAPPPTSVVTASSAPPTTTEVQTSFIIITPSATRPGETPSVLIITSVITPTNAPAKTTATGVSSSARATSTNPTELQNAQKDNGGGLNSGGKTAIAVVIPVVVVALLVLGGLFFWRKRKQRKVAEDERRKEVEEYGYNPNHDPTLPAVGMAMAEDDSGYRGWGNTATSSNRKASTTLASGMTYSDSNSNPGGYQSPNSPTNGTYSDANSNDPLVNGRRETLDSDGIGALGAVGGAAPNSSQNASGVHRGPSNASSSYSAAGHSDNSGEYPGMPNSNPQEFYNDNQGYYQSNPYGQPDPYAGNQQPIIRDVSARRNTRIENPSVFPQQGNSGIAQNF
ncbi:uncharacterized protein K460DRAFT_9426 [Cucurbitaria berberidis CBS 394.84]|uniref:Uncharacterized protein n=1 Tax=Cucurbitaria berberidis CBS 394.84 TaxID=1168544 RepID=A0A9P4GS19_9PLEO|nr:uncharacterized protein K460DRAFT_9426 [Cucurbitaria berberidis CBS 394.84]KAF1850016.1 hypothetical protein K460DRAFT_9426 [Cucurbitaria berberidis CBS 394.84]